MMWLALGVITAVVGLFIVWRVWSGDFDGTPYPALNGTKLEQAIREQLARKDGNEEKPGVWGACEFRQPTWREMRIRWYRRWLHRDPTPRELEASHPDYMI